MGRRNEHSREELQALAVGAARAIVLSDGAAALSTRRVAATIGYTAGSLYLVFRNLDELVLRLNGDTLTALHAHLAEVTATPVKAASRLPLLARAYVQFAFDHWPLWSLIFERPRPEAPPAWYAARIAATFALVEGQLQAAAPGRTAPEIRLAAQGLWSGVHGLCGFAFSGRLDAADVAGAQQAAEALVRIVVAGLRDTSLVTLVDPPVEKPR
jgi:AcrR family transcriptional regulator